MIEIYDRPNLFLLSIYCSDSGTVCILSLQDPTAVFQPYTNHRTEGPTSILDFDPVYVSCLVDCSEAAVHVLNFWRTFWLLGLNVRFIWTISLHQLIGSRNVMAVDANWITHVFILCRNEWRSIVLVKWFVVKPVGRSCKNLLKLLPAASPPSDSGNYFITLWHHSRELRLN